MQKPNLLSSVLMAGALWFPQTKEALYLDPGSGSFILQMLIAGAAGAIYIFRDYFRRFFAFFKRTEKSDEDEE